MNVFKELTLSIYDFKSYKGFIKNKRRKVFFSRSCSYGPIFFTDHDCSIFKISV